MADNTCDLTNLACQWSWIVDEAKSLFVWFSEQIFNGVVAVLHAIPVPSWASNVGSLSLPSEVAWAASAFELPYAGTVIASAYAIRFVIRRLPFIG